MLVGYHNLRTKTVALRIVGRQRFHVYLGRALVEKGLRRGLTGNEEEKEGHQTSHEKMAPIHANVPCVCFFQPLLAKCVT